MKLKYSGSDKNDHQAVSSVISCQFSSSRFMTYRIFKNIKSYNKKKDRTTTFWWEKGHFFDQTRVLIFTRDILRP
ncbi:XXYS1_4_G0030100.mRNA.1.CDS.1 [Saccharomyces cerevisiae]|nr:XXYS1_4_G0030100.mRNA.1.CDS.1 [Saccharomyces cerevisiae]